MINQLNRIARCAIGLALISAASLSTAPAVAQEWKGVAETSLVIRDGSPLDFSQWLPSGTAGAQGRVTINSQGRLAFANNPALPAKLNCMSLAWGPTTGNFPTHELSDTFARQIKVHGYNLVRFHFVEASLMTNRIGDFDFDPDQLDKFYYFLAALKKQGIYWVFDAMSSENGAYGNVFPNRWIEQYNLKFLVHVDEKAAAHWRMLVDKLYLPKNPYTGISLLADPALAGVVMVNEGGMNFLAQVREGGWRPELLPLFNTYLKTRYTSDAAVAKAWGDVRSDESLSKGNLRMPEVLRKVSPRMADFQRFLTDLESKTGKWMVAHLRSRGYAGPATAYDNWNTTTADASRATFDWVDMHFYHDEAVSYSPGTKMLQTSSTDSAARYVRWLASSRHTGKPFSVTEYGQPFWNRYRFEAGAILPAMAAFQGWDFACLHASGGIDLTYYQTAMRKVAIFPYGVGLDPVTRAGETLAALLYMRGDVTPAPHRVVADYTGDAPFINNYLDAVPDDIGMTAWMTGVGTMYSGENSSVPVSLKWLPQTPNQLTWGMTNKPVEMSALSQNDQAIYLRIDALRKAGILNSANRSSVTAGIYESETNQLYMDTKARRFVVTTPKTEAITTAAAATKLTIKSLTVNSVSGPGLISASSLDGLSLAQSKKILLIYATDAQNTGMTFADAERKELVTLGKMPVQILGGVANLTLSLSHATNMKLTPLTLNGEKASTEMAMKRAGNSWTMALGTVTAPTPTTFFLLEAR